MAEDETSRFSFKTSRMRMKITKANANRCKSRLNGLKMKSIFLPSLMFMLQQQLKEI